MKLMIYVIGLLVLRIAQAVSPLSDCMEICLVSLLTAAFVVSVGFSEKS